VQIANVRKGLGSLLADVGSIQDLRDQIRLLHSDLDDLGRYKRDTRRKMEEINSRLDEMLEHGGELNDGKK
jgi:predicted nuclease with TOPRIM domain